MGALVASINYLALTEYLLNNCSKMVLPDLIGIVEIASKGNPNQKFIFKGSCSGDEEEGDGCCRT